MEKYYPVVVLESRSRRESKVPYYFRLWTGTNEKHSERCTARRSLSNVLVKAKKYKAAY